MSKLLLFAVIVVVVYVLIKSAARSRARRSAAGAPPPESMVACAQCGVNLPRSEALEAGGRFYCSEEHRRIAAG